MKKTVYKNAGNDPARFSNQLQGAVQDFLNKNPRYTLSDVEGALKGTQGQFSFADGRPNTTPSFQAMAYHRFMDEVKPKLIKDPEAVAEYSLDITSPFTGDPTSEIAPLALRDDSFSFSTKLYDSNNKIASDLLPDEHAQYVQDMIASDPDALKDQLKGIYNDYHESGHSFCRHR